MCGYIQRVTDSPHVAALMRRIGLGELLEPLLVGGYNVEHFYPAFGGAVNRKIRGVIIEENGEKKLINPTWWFDCSMGDEGLEVGKRTTFNARNLDSPFWKGALRHHRAIVIATSIGESKFIDGKKHQFLMKGEAFILGALYRKFDDDTYSCAVITRNSHPKFEPYHDKAFPLFLPPDESFIDIWLDKEVTQDPLIDELLDNPKLYPCLEVTRVKSYKSAQKLGESILLDSDLT